MKQLNYCLCVTGLFQPELTRKACGTCKYNVFKLPTEALKFRFRILFWNYGFGKK